MQKEQVNSQGFGVIGIVTIVAVLVVIGLTGATVYHHDHQAKLAAEHSSKATVVKTDPYAGWKTVSLQAEKATFQYPGSWKLQNKSWVPADTPGISPGTWADQYIVTSPTGLSVDISTGEEEFQPLPNPTILSSQPINTLGGSYKLEFFAYGNDSTANVQGACVTASNAPDDFGYIDSKTITQAAGEPGTPAHDSLCIEDNTKPQGTPPRTTVSAYEHNSSFNDAKLIIESVKYRRAKD